MEMLLHLLNQAISSQPQAQHVYVFKLDRMIKHAMIRGSSLPRILPLTSLQLSTTSNRDIFLGLLIELLLIG
eukprot:CAMPEP_0194080664 /NCGR_PEP_ID=MMETSP0149-20130528/6631_1 /TAXON_ID=122233 /ORGANISM="Chaetoceros debilis, Strain MM31A-1" /LENGTH=71 /DNA_ID=CAMNT_0038762431 /DNA_START=1 /DNA_END=212 /DNA_ORIENTATION=+